MAGTCEAGDLRCAVSLPPNVRDAFATGAWDTTGLLLDRFEEVSAKSAASSVRRRILIVADRSTVSTPPPLRGGVPLLLVESRQERRGGVRSLAALPNTIRTCRRRRISGIASATSSPRAISELGASARQQRDAHLHGRPRA